MVMSGKLNLLSGCLGFLTNSPVTTEGSNGLRSVSASDLAKSEKCLLKSSGSRMEDHFLQEKEFRQNCFPFR